MLVASAQGTALNALSNVLAQVISRWRAHTPFAFNWMEFFRFTVVMFLLSPPIFYWQMWMESNWPGEPRSRHQDYLPVASDFELDDVGRDSLDSHTARPAEDPKQQMSAKLRWRNIWIKWLLDNSFGAVWYTLLFIILIEIFKWHNIFQIWQALLRVSSRLCTPDRQRLIVLGHSPTFASELYTLACSYIDQLHLDTRRKAISLSSIRWTDLGRLS